MLKQIIKLVKKIKKRKKKEEKIDYSVFTQPWRN